MYVYEFHNTDEEVYYANKADAVTAARDLQRYLIEEHGPHDTALKIDRLLLPKFLRKGDVVAILNRRDFVHERKTIWSPELDANF